MGHHLPLGNSEFCDARKKLMWVRNPPKPLNSVLENYFGCGRKRETGTARLGQHVRSRLSDGHSAVEVGNMEGPTEMGHFQTSMRATGKSTLPQ
jgi:hypothetical protein